MDNRFFSSFKALVLAALPQYPFAFLYRFTVASMVGNRVSLQPVSRKHGLPDTVACRVHPGMAGLQSQLTPGAQVLVAFIEGDPRLPVVTHFATADDPGFLPVELALDATSRVAIGASAGVVEIGGENTVANPAGRFVRWGDSVVFPGPGPGTLAAVAGTPTAKVKTP